MKALILVLLTGAANATGTPTPQTPTTPQVQTQSAGAAAAAKSSAVSVSGGGSANAVGGGSTATATGAGGGGGTGGNGQGGSVSGDSAISVAGDASDYKSLGLVLPPPASTPPLPSMPNCDADTRQSAFSFGLGLFSQADSRADPTDCTLLKLRHLKQTQCQYASAKQIEDLMLTKLLPGYVPTPTVAVDHTQAGCAALTNPPPAPVVKTVTEYQTRYIYLDPPKVEAPKVKPRAKPKAPCPAVQQACKPN